MRPEISVIVPVYKVADYIHRCIDSILSQTFHDFELILIDDGSPDSCPKICDEYAELDKRVRVFHKRNEGQSAARNLALDNCRGRFITFVDSDDWIEPQLLFSLYHGIVTSGCDISVSKFIIDSKKNSVVPFKPCDNKEMDTCEALQDMLCGIHFAGQCCGKIYKAELFNGIRFKVGVIYEDLLLNTQLFLKYKPRIYYMNMCKYHYIMREDSSTNSNKKQQSLDALYVNLEIYQLVKENMPELEDKVYAASLERIWVGVQNSFMGGIRQNYGYLSKTKEYFRKERNKIANNREIPKYLRIYLPIFLVNIHLCNLFYRTVRCIQRRKIDAGN